jgi:PadR family transcriptional regulator, regulatory protein AphA
MGKENKSRFALLGMLSLKPMSGYDLKKAIELSVGHFWHENYPQIYPILKQLTNEGLTTCAIDRHQGRPERSIYTLTDSGWNVLRHWLSEPFDYPGERNELLLKLFFGELVPISVSLKHVRQHRTRQENLLQMYQQTEVAIRERWRDDPRLPYWLLTLSQGRAIAQALLVWCDEALVLLEQQKNISIDAEKRKKRIYQSLLPE